MLGAQVRAIRLLVDHHEEVTAAIIVPALQVCHNMLCLVVLLQHFAEGLCMLARFVQELAKSA